MFFNPMYWVFIGPALLLSLYAQWKVKSTYAKYSRVPASSGATAQQVAQRILEYGATSLGKPDLRAVRFANVPGQLTDHYDPRTKTVKLSNPDGRSLAEIGVAAHEVGHALQDASNYQPLMLRSALVPVTQIGSTLAIPLILGGIFLNAANLVLVGIIGFALAVLFTLVTLPVEFDASRRAMKHLRDTGAITSGKEMAAVKQVLNAAALTYVAAAIAAVLQLLYYVLMFMNNNRR